MTETKIIDPQYRKALLKKADKYRKATGVSMSYLGTKIVNDADFFPHLKSGGDCRAGTLVKAEQWLDTNLSEGTTQSM